MSDVGRSGMGQDGVGWIASITPVIGWRSLSAWLPMERPARGYSRETRKDTAEPEEEKRTQSQYCIRLGSAVNAGFNASGLWKMNRVRS
jgi:hypothetical protein